MKLSPNAKQAILEEAVKLTDASTWNVNTVPKWIDVAREARAKGKIAHVCHVSPICSIKHVDLPENGPRHKHKRRVVLQVVGDMLCVPNWVQHP